MMTARKNAFTNSPSDSSESAATSERWSLDIAMESGTAPAAQRLSASGTLLSGQPGPLKMPFAPGDVIAGKYQVIGLVGAGGVAFVVAALHLELGEMVALKFLRPEALAHEEVVERFATEARSAARIRSEHVCRVYDVGYLTDGAPFIVMEFLEGKDLSDIVREQGKIAVKVAVDYVVQACEALACAHSTGIVHRDVKPENLFLTQQTGNVHVVKVLDFGISKSAIASATQGKRRFAKTMMPMGTPAYMSPEQIRACGTVDERADIWALGCVLFELVTGACAFDAPTLMQLGAAILEREPIPLRKIVPEAPAGLEAIIAKCLAKDPAERYQNVAELALDLYPYGPRRARHGAERCSQILHASSGSVALLELSSISPPPLASSSPAPSTSGIPQSAAAHASSAPTDPPSEPAARATSAAALPGGGVAAAAAPVKSVAAAKSVDEPPAFRPKRRWVSLLALAALAGAGGVFFMRSQRAALPSTSSAQATPATPVATQAAPAPTLGAPELKAQAQPAQPKAEPSAATTPEASDADASKPRARRMRPPPAPAARRDVAAAPKPRATAARAPSAEDEPDVGY